jgi:RNA polymerase sigma-70 factor (ECF subfamily)
VTASALFPAPHISLMSLTRDDSTRPVRVARSTPRSTGSVLTRVAQGDAIAARECVDQFGGLVWSIARRLAPSRADAEAAVQEIFNDVFRTAARFDPAQGSEKLFVATIARRRLIDRMRHAARQNSSESMDVHALSWAPDTGAGVCVEALAASQAVTQLRPELQRVLELGVLQGKSHAEIAETLGIPVATVKAMMHRGLIQVRELMLKQL